MTESLNQQEKRVNKLFILVPFVFIGLSIAAWFIGATDAVPSSHALQFLIYQDPWYIALLIVDAIALALLTIAVVKQSNLTSESKWPYVVTIIIAFATIAIFAITRSSITDNVNVAFRYNAFSTLKGWK